MKIWKKKEVSREVVKEIHDRYQCDALTAAILARRGITNGNDILYYLEDDERYLHSPFCFSSMEDAVDRVIEAAEEGEKVLVFGDRDADGITSTAILYEALKDMQIDVRWRIPTGDDPYGLTIQAVDEFASDFGTLIITVDCGIANNAEIAHAATLGIDVIVLDHHNPQEELPSPAIIINPKVPSCNYPFDGLSGCGVAYKFISALRFSKNELYKQQICLLNVRPLNDSYVVEAIKTVNCCEYDRITETIIPNLISITQTRLLPFLQGQQIFVWDEPLQRKLLSKAFGNGVEFNMLDIRPEISKIMPSLANISLLRLAPMSKIAKFSEKETSELDAFFNIFVTFVLKKIALYSPRDKLDLQLVSLSTLADLMPLKNENRILVRIGLNAMNSGKIRHGLSELFARQNMIGKQFGTTDLTWNITPVLNAGGRLGQPETGVELFLENDPLKRSELADKMIQFNKERKQLGLDVWPLVEKSAYDSFAEYNQNFAVAVDEHIHRGVTGILATKLIQYFKVPSIVIAFIDEENAVGSIRSTRGYDVTSLLEQCAEFLTNHGGHAYAAGFSLEKKNIQSFLESVKRIASTIEFSQNADEEIIEIDAELPHSYMTPDLLNLVDRFEPYGESNPCLCFISRNLKIISADILGKIEAKHLKLTLSAGSYKWPALYWNAAEKLKTEFDIGDSIDAVFTVGRNYFNGSETAQLIITDIQKSDI
ncbi:MAG: single-stranded-DNA-specific exonuclease RecJ [Treponema sp.]|nr:single-stranded-DNA-specific exonuclease RecJ [Treponema sp.]